jgi:hypothetical protein
MFYDPTNNQKLTQRMGTVRKLIFLIFIDEKFTKALLHSPRGSLIKL